MEIYPILFYVFGAAAAGFGLLMVVSRRPVASAVSLLGLMISLAAVYLLLGAEFLAVSQVILYVGVFLALFVLSIQWLPARVAARGPDRSRMASLLAAPLLILLGTLLLTVITREFPSDSGVRFGTFPVETATLGRRVFLYYILPFELVSVVIVVAVIGAIHMTRKKVEG